MLVALYVLNVVGVVCAGFVFLLVYILFVFCVVLVFLVGFHMLDVLCVQFVFVCLCLCWLVLFCVSAGSLLTPIGSMVTSQRNYISDVIVHYPITTSKDSIKVNDSLERLAM